MSGYDVDFDPIPPAPDFRPRQQSHPAPCVHGCPNSADVRGWIGWVAQRHQLGLSREEAYRRAWQTLVALNPFPATLGRICPHPCETGCGRAGLDGAVRVHALERFLGDWAIEQGLELPLEEPSTARASVGVVGGGPAGLSLAYQMTRRGHAVVIYDANPLPGGMLRYAIPDYRLPRAVVDAEIQRVLDLGVELVSETRVGRDVSPDELRSRHDLVFLAIGAQRGLALHLDGDGTAPVVTGIDYLRDVKTSGEGWLGDTVLIIGGGNTAVDAARTARRAGSEVVVAYRRSREQMPALDEELDAMLAEGVQLLPLVSPVALERGPDGRTEAVLQEMRLGPPDPSGRPRPVPIPGRERRVSVDAVIAAVAQEVAWDQLSVFLPESGRPPLDREQSVDGGEVWVGGDALRPDLAVRAVADGRRVAEVMHAWVVGEPTVASGDGSPVEPAARLERYEGRSPEPVAELSPEAALAESAVEVTKTLEERAFLREAARCLSCGLCFGCQRCWMYCSSGGFRPVSQPEPGRHYVLDLAACEACGKCVDVCPTGYLEFRIDYASGEAVCSVDSGIGVLASTR